MSRAAAPERGTTRVDAPRRASWVARIQSVPTASILVGLVVLLCVVGLVMVSSAGSVISINLYGTPWAIVLREILWMAVGVAAFVFTSRLDYRRWRRFSGVLLIGTFFLLLVVLVPGVGIHASGASRWIGFGQFQVQPSEVMKLVLAVFGADFLVRRRARGANYRMMLGPLLMVASAAALLILLQPDLGTALVIGAVTIALLFGSGVPLRPVAKLFGILAVLGVLVSLTSSYRRQRLLSFIHPGSHQSSSGYQVVQSLIGLGSGHLFGLGLGAGRQKWGLLPNAHTDFIFSVIGEELGLIGAIVVLVLLGAFAWFGLRAALRAPDEFGSLLGVALVAWIATETVINVGAVVGILPVTGIPLPFISFGGSSLIISMIAAGILVNIARQERRPGLSLHRAPAQRPERARHPRIHAQGSPGRPRRPLTAPR